MKKDTITRQLYTACQRNDVQGVRQCLAQGADVNMVTPGNQPLLAEMVVQTPYPEIIRVLLEYGADPNLADGAGRSAVHCAGICNRMDALRLLMAYGADVRLRDNDGKTPYDYSAAYGADPQVLEYLARAMNRQENPEQKMTRLFGAIRHRDRKTLERLLVQAPKLLRMKKASQVVAEAVRTGDTGVTRLVMESGFSPDQPDSYGDYPMHVAARYGHVNIIELLTAHGVRTDQVNAHGYIPLHLAIVTDRVQIQKKIAACRALLSAGSPRISRDKRGKSMRAHARAHGLNAILADLPPDEEESPLDPTAHGIAEIILYNNGKLRVAYHPNNDTAPLTISDLAGRDGWMPWPERRMGGLSMETLLTDLGLQMFHPLLAHHKTGRRMPADDVIQTYQKVFGKKPEIIRFK